MKKKKIKITFSFLRQIFEVTDIKILPAGFVSKK